MDHGFWQVSPDLFRSFYRAAGFRCLTSALFVLGRRPYAIPATENLYRTHGRSFVVENVPEAVAVFAARKEQDIAAVGVRMQDYYSVMHEDAGGAATGAEFFVAYGSVSWGKFARGRLGGALLTWYGVLRRTLRCLAPQSRPAGN